VTRYRVVHETRYRYSAPVSLGHHLAHLGALDTAGQRCEGTRIEIDPAPAVLREWTDFFGNRVTYFSVETAHERLTVRAVNEVALAAVPGPAGEAPGLPWEAARDRIASPIGPRDLAARDFAIDSPLVAVDPRVRDYAAPSFPAGRPLVEAVEDLMSRIHRDFAYDPELTTVSTPLSEVLDHRRGVCQDFAHLAIACARARGLAACYVSGYLETDPPPGVARLTGADASHAWFSVYCPGAGWLDFDPTNNQVPIDRHITLARGRDYADVAPLRGVLYGGGAHTLEVAVTVERVGNGG
jgi:transglutaminase-like putative cysteine protease